MGLFTENVGDVRFHVINFDQGQKLVTSHQLPSSNLLHKSFPFSGTWFPHISKVGFGLDIYWHLRVSVILSD